MLSPPLDELEADANARAPAPGLPRAKARWSKARVHRRRRRMLAVVAAVLAVFLLWLAMSLGSALTNPALGSSTGARAAEWFREHGGASIVVWAENEWYSHHQPKVGGALAPGHHPQAEGHVDDHCRGRRAPPSGARADRAPGQPACRRRRPVVAGRPPGERRPGGLRDDAATRAPSTPATSSAWPGWTRKLLKATLYSGSQIPGGGPYTHTAPISPTDATSLVAAFNAGFLMSDANGGYYTDDKTVIPLRTAPPRSSSTRTAPPPSGNGAATSP